MKKAYRDIIGHVFSILEGHELNLNIDFGEYDPDNRGDVRKIAKNQIKPAYNATSDKNQELIKWSIQYFSIMDSPEIDRRRADCQYLSLCDPDSTSWCRFLWWLGTDLFGLEAMNSININEYTEDDSFVPFQDIFDYSKTKYNK